ncbi:hypothetical protein COT47_00390 [Candidatus Woesearchaeota archaeon CG08_land_8_20_14_0_20_43_7]|nr:MAG: hypothetical protein COT47_00390 [Candidatus Woesearchaeota archaeon CG08_land_8_20_14_0_20_43_7]
MGIFKAYLDEIRYGYLNLIDHMHGSTKIDETQGDHDNPIIALHGYCQMKHTFTYLQKHFAKNDRTVIPIGYGSFYQDIRRSAEQAAEGIERIAHDSPTRRVDMIGHSMGGLVGAYIVKALDQSKYVDRIVALGSPFQGTVMAHLGVGKSAGQMVPGSDFLEELCKAETPATIFASSVFSDADELLIPHKNGWCPGWKNILVQDVAHLGLIYNKNILDKTLELISRKI